MFKPMLAFSKTPELSELKYPVLASPKLDGVRCLIVNGVAVSRSLKPIPNKYVQSKLGNELYNGLDGELCLAGNQGLDFNSNQSAFMSVEGKPVFRFNVFDCFEHPHRPFSDRLNDATIIKNRALLLHGYNSIRVLPQDLVHNADDLAKLWDKHVDLGYEGSIVRDPVGHYKCGRSTLKQGLMIKLKMWMDAEFEIKGFEELMHNDNEATIDNLGHQVRSSHQANQVGGDTLGALVLDGFKVGTGFDTAERKRLWANRDELIGKKVTIKYNGLSSYGVPRFPVYKGLRDVIDC